VKIVYTIRAKHDLLALGYYLLQNDFATTPLAKIHEKINVLKTVSELGRNFAADYSAMKEHCLLRNT